MNEAILTDAALFRRIRPWRDFRHEALNLFPTESALRWFIRQHDGALVKSGALLKFARGTYIDPVQFQATAIDPHAHHSLRGIATMNPLIPLPASAADSRPMPSRKYVLEALAAFLDPTEIVELRALHPAAESGKRSVSSGYFDAAHWQVLADEALKLNVAGAQVYVTLNPVNPDLLARAPNRMRRGAVTTTGDREICRRRWILVDIDPARPPNTGSTNKQNDDAFALGIHVKKSLSERGWPKPVAALSGNGMHLLYAVDLANDETSKKLVHGVLAGLAHLFDTETTKIDRKVGNASRIVKLHGTVAAKGEHSDDTPHRLSSILSAPARINVTEEQLRELASLAPEKKRLSAGAHAREKSSRDYSGPLNGFDVEKFLLKHGIQYVHGVHDGRDRFRLATCPFNLEHVDAAIFSGNGGVIAFSCFHNSCADRTWPEFREHFDGPRPHRSDAVEEQIDLTAVLAARALRKAGGMVDGVLEDDSRAPAEPSSEPLTLAPATDFAYPPQIFQPPGMLGRYVDWVLRTSRQPQPILAVANALALHSVLLGHKVSTVGNSRTNNYLVGLAETGFGKDHARHCTKVLLEDAGQLDLLGGEELKSGAGLLSAVASRPNCLFLIDEFGNMMRAVNDRNASSHERGIVDALLKLFGSAKGIMLGPEYADKRARPRVDIPFPNASLYGTTVPKKFYESLDTDSICGGFLNRLLIVEAPSAQPAIQAPEQSRSAPAELIAWVKATRAISPGIEDSGRFPIIVPYGPMAETLLLQFEEELRNRAARMRAIPALSPLADIWARAYEHVTKIALLVACSKVTDMDLLAMAGSNECLVMDSGSVEWAIVFVRAVCSYMEGAASTRLSEGEHDRRCQEASRFLDRARYDGLTQRDLNTGSRGFRALTIATQRDVLESLQMRGEAVAVPDNRTIRYFGSKFAPKKKCGLADDTLVPAEDGMPAGFQRKR